MNLFPACSAIAVDGSSSLRTARGAEVDGGFIAKISSATIPGDVLRAKREFYAARPNSSAMKSACVMLSSLATHLARPFRIMFIASIPCNVRHAVTNEP